MLHNRIVFTAYRTFVGMTVFIGIIRFAAPLVLFYLAYIVFTKTKIHLVSALKNYWIWILSLIFVIGDKALFIANQSPDSKVTIMTLLKQAGCIVTILAGKFIFKEKNIGYKLFCACVIITGIVLSVAMK